MSVPKTIVIDGTEYIQKNSVSVVDTHGKPYVIVRANQAGVFAGYLESIDGNNTAILKQARRIHYWEGAASLSQLAQSGTSKPLSCRFPEEVTRIRISNVIEVLDVTAKAKESIASVKIWQA